METKTNEFFQPIPKTKIFSFFVGILKFINPSFKKWYDDQEKKGWPDWKRVGIAIDQRKGPRREDEKYP